jgi:NADH dehydrogenase
LISYELILSSALLLIVLLTGTLNLSVIIEMQKATWFILPLFPIFYIFLIASIAETNRAPFDLAEAESELVSGFMTEHAAGIFVFFFLAEYASIILICILITIILLGGYDILTLIYFMENILYTLSFLLLTFVNFVYLNLIFLIHLLINILGETINNKLSNISLMLDFNHFYLLNNLFIGSISTNKLDIFYKFYSIKEDFQLNNYIFILINEYVSFIKLNLEYNTLYLLENYDFTTNYSKNILNNNLILSLMYTFTISIKSIILIFFFI